MSKKPFSKSTAIVIAFSIFTLLSFNAVSQNKNYAAIISAAADKIEQRTIAWRHDIHQNPELGNREFRTSALIAKHLQSLGLEVKTGVGKTGVVGILKGGQPGPVVITGAEDFSFFAQKVPGLYFRIGGMPKGQDPKMAGPHHTPEFFIDDSSFKTGINALCNLVLDYMEMKKK